MPEHSYQGTYVFGQRVPFFRACPRIDLCLGKYFARVRLLRVSVVGALSGVSGRNFAKFFFGAAANAPCFPVHDVVFGERELRRRVRVVVVARVALRWRVRHRDRKMTTSGDLFV